MKRRGPFRSRFAEELRAYVDLKRALGRKFQSAEHVLGQLDDFLFHCRPDAEDLTRPLIEAWIQQSPDCAPTTHALHLRILRQFCLYRRRTHPTAYVPDRHSMRPTWPARTVKYRPHIYTEDEVRRLLDAALGLASTAANPLRPKTIFNILLLLYTTGMRVSEALRVKIGDVDWVSSTLVIRDTKFFKSRMICLQEDVLGSLRDYQIATDRAIGQPRPTSPLFRRVGNRGYSVPGFTKIAIGLLRACGLKPAAGRGGGRIHDLRHTFAVHRLTRWYREGADVQNLLPKLSTFMGHTDIKATLYYITLTNEIMQRAGRKFAHASALTEER